MKICKSIASLLLCIAAVLRLLPVPVLTACGLLCIVAGLIRRKGSVQE